VNKDIKLCGQQLSALANSWTRCTRQTSQSTTRGLHYWHDNVACLSVCLSVWLWRCALCKIHHTAEVSETRE